MQRNLDKIDIRILALLEEEGRIQNQRLAESVFLSPGACSQRLRRLEKERFIKGYRAEVDIRRICDAVSIFTVLKLSEQGSLKQVHLLKALEDIPAVVDCFEIAGDADFLVRFDCSNIEEYHEHITALLSDPNLGVSKSESHIILRHVSNLRRSGLSHLVETTQQ